MKNSAEPKDLAQLLAALDPAADLAHRHLWLIYLLNWVAWFMLLSWLPTVLKAGGLPASEAPFGTVIVNAVFIICAIPLRLALLIHGMGLLALLLLEP